MDAAISSSNVFLDQRTVGRRKRKEIRSPTSNHEVMLYYYPHSFHCQQVLMVLHEKGISFDAQIVDVQLGEQFSEEFLQINNKGEVPVLIHNLVTVTESAKIIAYLDDNFNQSGEIPRLIPRAENQKQRVESYYRRLSELNLPLLTLGSVIFPGFELKPRGVFAKETNRLLLKEYIQHRQAIYRTQAYNFQEYSIPLNDKAEDAKQDMPYLTDRKFYETLVISFERLLNDVERELRCRHDPSHVEHSWWLCSPTLSIADISFGLILHRMSELGFGERIWSNRPLVAGYYRRFQKVTAFQKTTRTEDSHHISCFFNITIGFVIVFLVLYYYLRGLQGPKSIKVK